MEKLKKTMESVRQGVQSSVPETGTRNSQM